MLGREGIWNKRAGGVTRGVRRETARERDRERDREKIERGTTVLIVSARVV